MNLGDDRGRVPFAVVGALLLVTSATLAVGIGAQPTPSGYDAGPAMAASWTATNAAAERAVLASSVRAARHPVVTPANTTYGRVVNGSDPFRAALRLRTYLALRDALDASAVTVDGVRAAASLPAIESPADARAAIDRVSLAPAANGSALRVRIENVAVVATRAGAPVERANRTLTVTADTPVLAVHERVRTFEARLDAGVSRPGLARRVTLSLTTLAEARGLAQYGGAPVSNVVANRHVALATNEGVLALERATFGRADPSGRAALRRAAVHAAGRDLLAGAQKAGVDSVDGWLNDSATGVNSTHGLIGGVDVGAANPQPVRLAPAADDALVAFADGTGPDSFDGALANATAVDVRLAVRTNTGDANASVPTPAAPPAPDGYRALRTVTDTATRDDTRYATTATRDGTRYATTATVGVRLADGPRVENASAWLDSESVANAVDAALPDSLAARAATGRLCESFTVRPTPPDSTARAARTALARTHAALRDVTDHTARRAFLTGRPLAGLDAAVARTVGDPPARVPTLDLRAAAVVRRAYADRVRTRVDARRSALARAQSRLRDVLADHGIPRGRAVAAANASAPAVPMRVSADPAYLSLARVTPADAPVDAATYPLTARNTNLFTVPAGDLADAVVGTGRSDPARFATAAATLRAAERADAPRARLDDAVTARLETVRGSLAAPLEARTALDSRARERALDAAFSRWETTGSRALAVANGTLPRAVARAAARRGADHPALLAARLQRTVRALRADRSFRIERGHVDAIRTRVRSRARAVLADTTKRAAERAAARSSLAVLPAGLPLLPVPGWWYVTANAWDVEARGGYERFAVAAPLGRPGVAGGTLRYVRENETVALDVDGDGAAERLGANDRLDFAAHAGAVAVVPAGPRGVGDTGNADERSAGWGK